MRILRLWAASAWADDELHPAEAAALRRLIDACKDFSAEQCEEARRLLENAPDLDLAAEISSLSPEARERVYRAAHTIVGLDRQVTDDEEAFLDRLRTELELDDATIKRIEEGY